MASFCFLKVHGRKCNTPQHGLGRRLQCLGWGLPGRTGPGVLSDSAGTMRHGLVPVGGQHGQVRRWPVWQVFHEIRVPEPQQGGVVATVMKPGWLLFPGHWPIAASLGPCRSLGLLSPQPLPIGKPFGDWSVHCGWIVGGWWCSLRPSHLARLFMGRKWLCGLSSAVLLSLSHMSFWLFMCSTKVAVSRWPSTGVKQCGCLWRCRAGL